jgi:hypothetical protein
MIGAARIATLVLSLLAVDVRDVLAQAAKNGPVPALIGTWESQTTRNNYLLRVSWNPGAGRYEGTLLQRIDDTVLEGFTVGELCWTMTPGRGAALKTAEARRSVQPGVPSSVRWSRSTARFSAHNPYLLVLGGTRFQRLGDAPAPGARPGRPAAARPAEPPAPGEAAAPAPARSAAAREPAHEGPSPFAAGKAQASADLSVFGIPLYEKVALPKCPGSEDATRPRSGAETCLGDAPGTMATLSTMMARRLIGEKEQEAGYKVVTARLADKACPDWVKAGGDCTAFLTVTSDDHLVGAAVATGPASAPLADKIERQLTKRYKRAPAAGDAVVCRNELTGVVISKTDARVWDTAGLRAVYTPVNLDCQRGMLVVESATLQRVRGAPKAKAEADAPSR